MAALSPPNILLPHIRRRRHGKPTTHFAISLMTPHHHCVHFSVLPTLIAVLLVTAILLAQPTRITAAQTECPRLCECKWKSGKESVLCLNANLTGLPPSLDAGTQVLDLTGNEVATILPDAFARANLLNLQKLFLAKCRLRSIDRFAFRKLINLVELDLSYNVLTMIPTHAFDSTPEMRELKIAGNPIQVISNDAFFNVPQLVRLELSDCRLTRIEERAFVGLEMSLEWLKLDGNRLVDVSSSTLTSLHNLHGLELAGNPWNCTCSLRPLRQWMLRENIPYGIPPVCKSPVRLSTKSWDKIELDDFACAPQIVALHPTFSGVEGRNVTLICAGSGSPDPQFAWATRNRIIANVTEGSEYPALTGKGRKLYIANRNYSQIRLTIVNVELHDAGVFVCSAENRAGKEESGVTLSVQRKPPESMVSQKMLFAGAISAAVLAVLSICLVVCLCSARKKRQIRWNKQHQRSESYEKIEMSSNSEGNNRGASELRGECSYASKPYAENGISVVGRKNGSYRTVPNDDDGTGYEDNIEGSLEPLRAKKKQPPRVKETSFQIGVPKTEATDLHIPRLIDFCDNAPDSGSSSLNGGQFEPNKSNPNSPTMRSSMMLYTKPNWHHQQVNVNGHNRRTSNESSYRTSSNPCNSDSKEQMYPDLLDISSHNSNQLSHQNSISRSIENNNQSGGAFCTFPRQRPVVHKTSASNKNPSVSDSQSLLIQSDCGMSSRYGSDGLESAHSRRMSEESYVNHQSVHLTNQMSQSQSNCKTILTQSRKQNPSLPTSPSRDQRTQTTFGVSATPLLDFKQLTSNLPGGGLDSPSPSASTTTSTTTANAYDYHAAQLERFLEEYRNLQKQLCKMKETCDSIRMKEVPSDRQHDGTLGQSVKCADPVLYSAATALNGSPVKLMDEAIHSGSPTNRKALLKSGNPRQPPDPPPYWLHRNAMLKRLQDPTAGSGSKECFPKS